MQKILGGEASRLWNIRAQQILFSWNNSKIILRTEHIPSLRSESDERLVMCILFGLTRFNGLDEVTFVPWHQGCIHIRITCVCFITSGTITDHIIPSIFFCVTIGSTNTEKTEFTSITDISLTQSITFSLNQTFFLP